MNSSLQVYVKHRESVLRRLKTLINKYEEEGDNKPELEATIHELFLKRGATLNNSSDINHLHNLWILDDGLLYFQITLKPKVQVWSSPVRHLHLGRCTRKNQTNSDFGIEINNKGT